jgi:hypothetical protein
MRVQSSRQLRSTVGQRVEQRVDTTRTSTNPGRSIVDRRHPIAWLEAAFVTRVEFLRSGTDVGRRVQELAPSQISWPDIPFSQRNSWVDLALPTMVDKKLLSIEGWTLAEQQAVEVSKSSSRSQCGLRLIIIDL